MRGDWLPGIKVGRTSVLEELFEAERLRPERTLLRWREGAWTVREFGTAARQMAGALRAIGVGAGDRVSVMANSSEWFAALWFGIYMVGAIEVPTNTELKGQLLRHVLEDADAAVVLVEPDLLATASDCGIERDLTPFDDRFIETGVPIADADIAAPRPHSLASIIHTSGTTGPSKGVMLSHGYFVNCADVWCNVLEIRPDDVTYWVFPFSHVDAHVQVAMAVESGATLAFVPRFSRTRFWSEVAEFKATAFGALGWMLTILGEDGVPESLEELKLTRGIACPISPENYEFFQGRLGIQLLEIYGQTEADSPCFGTLQRRKRGSAGWPCSGYDVEIHDSDGGSLPVGQQGEIVYRPGAANMVCQGYWRREATTLEAWRDLWFHSGDLGHFDEEGFLFFDGRLKDVIRCRGENVSAFELESTLRSAPGVFDCVALAVPAETGGEDEIRVLVVPSGREELDPSAFFEFCERNLARFALPRYLELVEESDLPRSAGSGAVHKHKLSQAIGSEVIDRLSFANDVRGGRL